MSGEWDEQRKIACCISVKTVTTGKGSAKEKKIRYLDDIHSQVSEHLGQIDVARELTVFLVLLPRGQHWSLPFADAQQTTDGDLVTVLKNAVHLEKVISKTYNVCNFC